MKLMNYWLNVYIQFKKTRLEEMKRMKNKGHYAEQVAATLRRFTPRQKAMAKMKIQELLFNVEFGSEPSTPTPLNQPINYHAPHIYYSPKSNY